MNIMPVVEKYIEKFKEPPPWDRKEEQAGIGFRASGEK